MWLIKYSQLILNLCTLAGLGISQLDHIANQNENNKENNDNQHLKFNFIFFS